MFMDGMDVNLFTLTRQMDPWTSDAAIESLGKGGQLAEQRQAVLRALQQHPSCTSAELAVYMEVDRHLPARRLPDLRNLGLVTEGPKRLCRIKGRMSVTWVAQEALK
jgi:hypothetical protein